MVFDHLHIKVSDARLRPAWAALGSKARRAEVAALVRARAAYRHLRRRVRSADARRRLVGAAARLRHAPPVSAKCDVYSFAMTAYEVILREKPFAGTSDVRWLAVESREGPARPAAPRARRGRRAAHRADEALLGALPRRAPHVCRRAVRARAPRVAAREALE